MMNVFWRKSKNNGRVKTCAVVILLVAALCIPMIGPAIASSSDPTPNQDILNAMLYGDRKWVIDTLVNDDRSKNPMAILQGNGAKKSLAKDSLETFRGINEDGQNNDAAYRGLVHVMEKWYNKEDYVESFVNKLLDAGGELLSWVTGLFSSQESVRETANRLTTSVDEMRYDSLLKGIFSAKYTASNGMTLQDTESSLMTVKQVKETFDFMKTVSSLARSHVDTIVDSSERSVFEAEYISEYALPYGDATQKYLEAVDKIIAPSGSDNSGYIELASNLAIIERLAVLAPTDTYDGFSFTDLIAENLVDLDVQDLLKANGKAINFVDTALDQYLYIESIRMQKESINGPLARLQATTGNSDIRASVQNFNTLLSDEYNNTLCSWDSLFTYLRNNRTVGKTASKFVTKKAKSAAMKLLHISDESMMCYVAAKATTVMDISSWVADQAVGLEATCKKTYELLSWEKLMNGFVTVYQNDLSVYRNNPSEESAEAVLDDLMALQKVRLYGEKIAYGLACAQTDNWIGALFDHGVTAEVWGTMYQQSVDELMAASVLPPMTGLTVQSGHRLSIRYRDDIGFYGYDSIIGEGISSDAYYIPELSAQLASGITVNGQLVIDNTSGRTLPIGYVDVNGTSTLGILNGAVKIGELYQSGGNLSLVMRGNGSVSFDRMYVGNVSYTADDPGTISTGDLEVYGTADLDISASGEVTGSRGVLDTLTLTGSGTQNVDGTLTVNTLTANNPNFIQKGTLTAGTLRMNGASATVEGSVSVTNTLRGPSNNLNGGRNIIFSGDTIEGGRFNGDLTVKNASVTDVRFAGTLYDQGGTIYAGNVAIEKALYGQQVSSINGSGRLSVYGATTLSYGISGGGHLDLYGDFVVSGKPTLGVEITAKGSLPQDFSGEFSVDRIDFANTSRKGVNVLNTITINQYLSNSRGTVTTSVPIFLGETARISDSYTGDVSILNWQPGNGSQIGGNLMLRSGGVISGGTLNVGKALILEGSGTIDQTTVTVNTFSSPTELTLQNGSTLTVGGNASIGGKLTSPTPIPVYGDLTVNGLTATGQINAKGDVIVSGTTTLDCLILDGTMRQEIAGGNFTVNELTIRNTSGKALKLGQTITVTGRYTNTYVTVEGGTIAEKVDQEITKDTVVNTGLNLSSPLVVTNSRLTVNGPVSVTGLTLSSGELVVNGKLTLSGSATIDENSSLTVNGQMTSTSGAITLNGAMNVRSDLILNATSLTGGALTLGCDLYGSGSVKPDSLTINGLVRQHISGDNIHTGDVTMRNGTNGGVALEKKIYYSGTLDTGTTVLSGADNLVKEAG